MKLKKFLVPLLSLIVVGTFLTACGSNNSDIADDVTNDQFYTRDSDGQYEDEVLDFTADTNDDNAVSIADLFDYNEEVGNIHYKLEGDKLKMYKDDYPLGVTKWYIQLEETPNKVKIVQTKDGETKTITGYSVNHESDVENSKQDDDDNY